MLSTCFFSLLLNSLLFQLLTVILTFASAAWGPLFCTCVLLSDAPRFCCTFQKLLTWIRPWLSPSGSFSISLEEYSLRSVQIHIHSLEYCFFLQFPSARDDPLRPLNYIIISHALVPALGLFELFILFLYLQCSAQSPGYNTCAVMFLEGVNGQVKHQTNTKEQTMDDSCIFTR